MIEGAEGWKLITKFLIVWLTGAVLTV